MKPKNPLKKSILAATSAVAALASAASAATLFTNGDAANTFITNAGNWDDGLPTGGKQGTINIDAGFDTDETLVNYNVVHSAGTINRANGLSGLKIGSGSTWVADGTAAYTGFRGLSVNDGGTYTQEAGVDGDFSNNSRDSQSFGAGSSITVNGGTMIVGRNLIVRNGASFTINGGTLTVTNNFLTQNFASAANGYFFNGGSTTANSFDLATAGTAFFGGSTTGSLSLASLGNGVTLDWFGGSRMSLTIAGADQAFYEGLYGANTLRFEDSNTDAFADIFAVSGETLSLIPEPSSSILVGLGLVSLLGFRRRKA